MLSALGGTRPLWAAEADEPIVVGSKNFEESRLLAEMFAQVIEERTGLCRWSGG